ncbi:MAG TPA: ATP-binding protein [Nitrospira sp.]|nr:ATP-binding protein [Nitrospira sp.]
MTDSVKSENDFSLEDSIPQCGISLEAILCTDELNRRPSRPPDCEKENRALTKLVSALADSPRTIFQILAETILEMTECDSAGLSLLTKDGKTPDVNGKRFYWPAIAGMWNPHVGGGTPRHFGPCGDVLDQNRTLLFRHFERRYPYLLSVSPAAEECLLVPFYVAGQAVGTIWAIMHSDRRNFDAEDDRVMAYLGKFASSAYQALSHIDHVLESAFHDRVKPDAPYRGFQQLAHAFNSMLDRLQKAYETERHFMDYAAHEMQTPLTILRGNLEVALQKDRSAEEYREVLVSNLNQVERLMRLIKSLLTLARFTRGRPPMQLAPVKLEPLLRELIEDLALLAADRNIRLSLEAESVPMVLGDELGLKQLVINLLDNALRHTDPGGVITVRLGSSGDEVTVTVQDNGHGIDPKHLPHLFDRFYRADSGTVRNSGGTGLGLPIVKEIATAHHGVISVESKVGKGSTFTLTLHAKKLLTPEV